VVGGLLGSMVGSGNGRVAAGAAGAAIGAMAGNAIGNERTAAAQPVQRCRTVDAGRDVVKGYHVVYRYNGRDVATTLPYDPGRTVRVGTGILDDGAYGGDYRNPGNTASRSDYDYGPAPRYDYTGATMSPNTPYYSY
ncbi:MAG: glycine zipper 2TM domain-containing protein, partial [Burkholderiales bacterium]